MENSELTPKNNELRAKGRFKKLSDTSPSCFSFEHTCTPIWPPEQNLKFNNPLIK